MQAINYLADFKKQFDPKLLAFLDKKEKQAKKIAPDYCEAIKEIKRLIKTGGKRLRPIFIYTGFNAVGGKGQVAWPACLAMELIHSFALIHDDIMDNAVLRRGKLTAYKKLGPNKAILVGDAALILADELIPKKAKKYFDLMKFELIGGQYLDVGIQKAVKTPPRWHPAESRDDSSDGGGFKENYIMRIMELKSARYTIARPLQIGAVLAASNAAPPKTMGAFFKYGKNLGIAFQIQDDILGIFGNEKTLGKSVKSDIKEGKKTLLIARLLGQDYKITRLQGKVKKFLSFFGKKKKLTKEQMDLTKSLMIESGALDYCQKKALQLIERAKRAIKDLEIRKKEKEFLINICDYTITRNL